MKTTKRQRKAARKLPYRLQFVATTKWRARKQKKHDARKLGRFGAASEVRHIDPKVLA